MAPSPQRFIQCNELLNNNNTHCGRKLSLVRSAIQHDRVVCLFRPRLLKAHVEDMIEINEGILNLYYDSHLSLISLCVCSKSPPA